MKKITNGKIDSSPQNSRRRKTHPVFFPGLRKSLKIILILFLPVIFFVHIFLLYSVLHGYDFMNNVNILFVQRDELVLVKYDPFARELLEVSIDGETLMNVSGNMGSYHLKNVYDLSINEGNNDNLLKRTFMKNFHLPVHLVVDCRRSNSGSFTVLETLKNCKPAGSRVKTFLYLGYLKLRVGNNIVKKDFFTDYVRPSATMEDRTLEIDAKDFLKLDLDFSKSGNGDDYQSIKILTGTQKKLPSYFSDVFKVIGVRIIDVGGGVYDLDPMIDRCVVISKSKDLVKNMEKVFDCQVIENTDVGINDASEEFIFFNPNYLVLF